MNSAFSASDAKALADGQHNKAKDQEILETLSRIYAHIRDRASMGAYELQLSYPKHGKEITLLLQFEGYKVRKSVLETYREYEEYLVISWNEVAK